MLRPLLLAVVCVLGPLGARGEAPAPPAVAPPVASPPGKLERAPEKAVAAKPEAAKPEAAKPEAAKPEAAKPEAAAAAEPLKPEPAPALMPTGPLTDMPSLVDDPTRRGPEPEIPRTTPPELEGDLDVGWALFKTMIVLVMVILLAWLTLNVGLRRLLGIKSPLGTSVVTVLERVPLDQKRSLFVIEAAGEVLLVGGGDAGLSLLAKLDRAEIDKLRAPRTTGGPVQLSPFLQKLLGRKDPASNGPPPPAAEPKG